MKKTKAKEKGYTHNGLMYGFIPIYLKRVNLRIDVVGKNKIWDILLTIFLIIDDLCSEGGGFYVWEGEKL